MLKAVSMVDFLKGIIPEDPPTFDANYLSSCSGHFKQSVLLTMYPS